MTARRRRDLEEAALKGDAVALEELAQLPPSRHAAYRALFRMAAAGDVEAQAELAARRAAHRQPQTPGIERGADGLYRLAAWRCEGCGDYVEPDPDTPDGHRVPNADGSPGYCGPITRDEGSLGRAWRSRQGAAQYLKRHQSQVTTAPNHQ